MYFAYWMVLVAALMPVATVGSAKAQRGYDNRNPREWLTRLGGWRARADSAHRNHLEAFPPFAAGVIIATLAGARHTTIDWLAGLFILFRLLYTAAYIADLASLRSVVWFFGVLCVVGLFVAGA